MSTWCWLHTPLWPLWHPSGSKHIRNILKNFWRKFDSKRACLPPFPSNLASIFICSIAIGIAVTVSPSPPHLSELTISTHQSAVWSRSLLVKKLSRHLLNINDCSRKTSKLHKASFKFYFQLSLTFTNLPCNCSPKTSYRTFHMKAIILRLLRSWRLTSPAIFADRLVHFHGENRVTSQTQPGSGHCYLRSSAYKWKHNICHW